MRDAGEGFFVFLSEDNLSIEVVEVRIVEPALPLLVFEFSREQI
jgi:hypothetical protein